jgi:hypothetical protein
MNREQGILNYEVESAFQHSKFFVLCSIFRRVHKKTGCFAAGSNYFNKLIT